MGKHRRKKGMIWVVLDVFAIFMLLIQPVGMPGLVAAMGASGSIEEEVSAPADDSTDESVEKEDDEEEDEEDEADDSKAGSESEEEVEADDKSESKNDSESEKKSEADPVSQDAVKDETTSEEPEIDAAENQVVPVDVAEDQAAPADIDAVAEEAVPAEEPVEAVSENAVVPAEDPAVVPETVVDAAGSAAQADGSVTEDGMITAEAAVIVAPDVEVAQKDAAISTDGKIKVKETEELWSVEGGKAKTNNPVELGKEYVFPGDKDVVVKFTKLPENPGTLSIEKVTLTKKQMAALGAFSDKAYDITSSMKNGSFEYDLTLPKPKNKSEVRIKYADNASELEDAETVPDKNAKIKTDSVNVSLDHFTVFAVAAVESPVVTPIDPIVSVINNPVSFTVSATNPNNGTLVYSLDAFSPDGVTIDPNTGVVNWTPSVLGRNFIDIIVSDGIAPDVYYSVEIMVISPGDFVAYPISPISVEVNTPISFTAMATNPNGGTLVFSLDPSAPAGASINSATGEFSWTPTTAGYYFFNILISDGIVANPITAPVDISVTLPNIPGPVITPIDPITVTVGNPVLFTVSATNPNNGTLVYSLDATAPVGAVINPDTGEFSWTPTAAGWEFFSVIVSDGIAPNAYADIDITVNPIPSVVITPVPQVVSDTNVPISFLVSATNPNNGILVYSLGGNPPTGAAINSSTGEFTWIPTIGGFYDITINVDDGVMPNPVSTTVNFNITNPSGPFEIFTSVSPNGWISPYLPGSNMFNLGDSVTYSFSSLIDHYVVYDVIVDGISVGPVNSYSFSNINANHTMDVIFGNEKHLVTVTAVGNGTVSPSGTTTVVYPDGINFVFTPDPGYHVASVVINGVDYGTDNFTYAPVLADLDVVVTFVATNPTYDIVSSAGPNGTISPLGTTTVLSGGSQAYTITPDPGYVIEKITVDGVDKGPSATYQFTNIVSSHTIVATFIPDHFNITTTAGPNGTITPLGVTVVPVYSQQSIIVAANQGYRIAEILIDGVPQPQPLDSYQYLILTNIKADHTIAASFELIPGICQTGADTDGSGSISNLEILSYVNAWKSGAVSNQLILQAIQFWKAGTGC
ncbi:MAG: putative Ig domain-containing protein [Candidatus Moranbacteria bacterium]|nr:putative Ig domain-containing protein [Candidatus Moranbacteria bacterium]